MRKQYNPPDKPPDYFLIGMSIYIGFVALAFVFFFILCN